MIYHADIRCKGRALRILVDLPASQIQALAELCKQVRLPRAAVIREAVTEYLERHSAATVDEAFGLWGNTAPDGLAYQEKARSEWLRRCSIRTS